MDDIKGTTAIEVDFELTNIYHSRNFSPFGYLAIVGPHRLMIYYIYDEDCTGADQDLVWDINYRFDNSVKKYGMHNCIDFEDKCLTFVSGTNIGNVCIWNLEERAMTHTVRVINPKTRRPQVIDLIRNIDHERKFVTFDFITQTLCITMDEDQDEPEIVNPKTIEL